VLPVVAAILTIPVPAMARYSARTFAGISKRIGRRADDMPVQSQKTCLYFGGRSPSSAVPEHIQLFRLFVGAPSDVDEALDVIRGQIEQWNRDHGPLTRARVEFTNWRTHSHPAAGAHPQTLLNKQVVDLSDIVVGVFRFRFGTPTRVAESGTEEEIRRSIKKGKTVMVYFAQFPSRKRRKDSNEFARIEDFKRKLGQRALYHTYTDIVQFEQAFRQHLAGAMNELLRKYSLQ
jgi:hypothetical protein